MMMDREDLVRFDLQPFEHSAEARSFGAAGVKSRQRRLLRFSGQMSNAHKKPGAVFGDSVFDQKIAAVASNAQTVGKIGPVWKILKRPIGVSVIGDHRAELARGVRLELDGGFQPALGGKAHHEPGLVVLVNRI